MTRLSKSWGWLLFIRRSEYANERLTASPHRS